MTSAVINRVIFFSIIVLILQIFIPIININGLRITPDILIIFLTYIGYYYGRMETIIIGENELAQNKVIVKNMTSGSQQEISISDITQFFNKTS